MNFTLILRQDKPFFVYFNINNIYLLVIFLLRYRCLTHLCLCLPSDILYVYEIWLNRIGKRREMFKIFADYERYNLFQFSAKMVFNGGDITHTSKLDRNTSPVLPAWIGILPKSSRTISPKFLYYVFLYYIWMSSNL